MSRPVPGPADAVGVDPGAVISDDRLLDLLGGDLPSGDLPSGDLGDAADPAVAVLREFRLAIDDVAAAAALRQPSASRSGTRRGGRTRGRVAVATLTAAGLLSVSGVAAAVPVGPLHRALFGAGRHHQTAAASLEQQIRTWLDEAGARLQDARRSGATSPAARASIAALLDRAGAALDRLPHGPVRDALAIRLTALRRELAALPAVGPSGGAAGTQARTGAASGSSPQPSQPADGPGAEPGATPEPTDSEAPQPATTDEPGTVSSSDPTSSSQTDSGTAPDSATASVGVPQDVASSGTSAEG